MVLGRFASSRLHLKEVLALYDPNSDRSLVYQAEVPPHVLAQAYLGNGLFCLGFADQALAMSNAAIAEARRLAHPPSLAFSSMMGTRLLSLIGDTAVLGEHVDRLVELATEQGFPFWRAQGTIFSGWVKVINRDVTGGIFLLRSGSAAYRATGAVLWSLIILAFWRGHARSQGELKRRRLSWTMLCRLLKRQGSAGSRQS